MDELEKRLRDGLEAARADAPGGDSAVVSTVRAGARRRRTVRGALTATAAVVALGVVGVGAWGLAGSDRPQEPAMPIASPSQGSPEPEPSGTVTESVTEDSRFDDSADGIAEGAYPALAADRNGVHDDIEYPQAHAMEDWVWDAVGEGWALDVAAVQWNIGYSENPVPPAVLYLVSPEDVHFEIVELPERAWASARVTSWREDQGAATIWWRQVQDDSHDGAGAVVDLRTGDIDDLVMAVHGENAFDYRFVMANAQGDELWRAESDSGVKFYRWSDGADEDGWVASALVEEAPDADDVASDVGLEGFTVSADGDHVLLRPRSEIDSRGTDVTMIRYALAADAGETFRFTGLEPGVLLGSASFEEGSTVRSWVTYPEDGTGDSGSWGGYEALFHLDGSGIVERIDSDEPWPEVPVAQYDVHYGEASPQAAGDEYCGC